MSEEMKQRISQTKKTPLEDRLLAKISKSKGCWLWTGYTQPSGYGYFSFRTEERKLWAKPAHRAVYELLVGEIPEGLVLDHTCKNRGCVNPDHLEPVTQRENLRRSDNHVAQNMVKTHCKHGHEFTSENTYTHPQRGSRLCKECRRNNSIKYSRQTEEKRI